MKNKYLEVIEGLRERLKVTDGECKKSTAHMDEQAEHVEELKGIRDLKEKDIQIMRETLESQFSRNQQLEEQLGQWMKYGKDQELYIQSLLDLFQQQGAAGGNAVGVEPKEPFSMKASGVESSEEEMVVTKEIPIGRYQVCTTQEKEDRRRIAVSFVTSIELSERQKEMIYLIGSQGISEQSKLASEFGMAFSSIREEFRELIQHNILETMEVLLDGKMIVYRFTDLGVGLYLYWFENKAPLILSDVEILIQEHQNAQHGYFIKDTRERLQQQGYVDVCTDRVKNTFQLPDNKQYVPDVVARNAATGETLVVECEHMNQSFKELSEKLLKATQITSTVHFIVPSKEEYVKLEKFYLQFSILLQSNGRKPVQVIAATRNMFKTSSWVSLNPEEMAIRYSQEATQWRSDYRREEPKSRDEDE